MLRILIVVIAMCCIANESYADWNYTKWGMSVEEVVAASNGKALKVDGFKSEIYEEKLKAGYETGKFKFIVGFFFDPKKHLLMSISLELKDAKNQSIELADALISKYGQPFWQSPDPKPPLFIHHRKWKGDGNLVRLMQIGEDATLIYEPLPNTNGL